MAGTLTLTLTLTLIFTLAYVGSQRKVQTPLHITLQGVATEVSLNVSDPHPCSTSIRTWNCHSRPGGVTPPVCASYERLQQ